MTQADSKTPQRDARDAASQRAAVACCIGHAGARWSVCRTATLAAGGWATLGGALAHVDAARPRCRDASQRPTSRQSAAGLRSEQRDHIAMIVSLSLLIEALPAHRETSVQLLLSAAGLWVANILVFASWYWRLDAGGPHARALTTAHTDGAFLFPQMAMDPQVKIATGEQSGRRTSSITCSWPSPPARRSRPLIHRPCRAGPRF